MTDIPPKPLQTSEWRIETERVSAWREWDGEIVVYDDLSGDTLKLDAMMSLIFRQLLRAKSTAPQLASQMAAALELDDDPKLMQLTELALRRLAGCGLAVREH